MTDIVNNNLGPLSNGQTVAVIGGGPAGTSCAIKLQRLAHSKGLSLRVLLFEHKNFAVERNICVGVLSPPFRKLLNELELSFPENIIQRRIKGYMVHSKRETVYLEEEPFHDGEVTVVVDRSDLDVFLLKSVRAAGVTVVEHEVSDVMIETDKVIVTGAGGMKESADVVVGAFGLDKKALSIFEANASGFRRPPETKSILTEIALGEDAVSSRLNGTIHAVLIDQLPQVEFGALTPKRNHVTVNIAGENVSDDDLNAFLRLPLSKKLIPEATMKEPRYYGGFPSAPARNIYGNRVVTIGNTSGLLRPLKGKGINTGVITGIEAAKTMMEVGISKHAFDDFYRRCQNLTSEFTYGTFLRTMYRLGHKLSVLDAVLALSRHEPLLHQAFYEMVSGEGSYREIVRRSSRPSLAAKMIVAIARYRVLGK